MPSGVSFRGYALVSVAVSAMVVLSTWMQYEQFYPTLVALSNSKPSIIIADNVVHTIHCILPKALVNVAIVLSLTMAWGVKHFFLGTLRDNEYEVRIDWVHGFISDPFSSETSMIHGEHLTEKLYPMILDLLLTVTLFRTSLSMSFFAMLEALMLSKCLHWLVNKRVEYMGQTPLTLYSTYVRLGVLMVLLVSLDALVVVKSAQAVLNESGGLINLFSGYGDMEGPPIHILYGFEFAILTTMMLGSMVRGGLIVWEMAKHSGRWDDKSTYLMYTDFVVDVFQFVIYMVFFLTLYAHVGLPITLVRPLLVAFSNFRKRVADLVRYRQATANMETRFPEATEAELAAAHNLCIICREDMNNGKKLPCGHVLHLRCLREWLEHQQTCPTCRLPVLGNGPQQQQQQQQQQRLAQQNNIFQAFGVPPPPAQGAAGAVNGQQQAAGFGPGNVAQVALQADAQGPIPGHLGPFGALPPHFFQNVLFPGQAYPGQPFYVPFPVHQQHQVPNQQDTHTTNPPGNPPSASASPSLLSSSYLDITASREVPVDVAHDMAELTSSISRDLDSLRSRMDVLIALMRQHGIDTSAVLPLASSSTHVTPVTSSTNQSSASSSATSS